MSEALLDKFFFTKHISQVLREENGAGGRLWSVAEATAVPRVHHQIAFVLVTVNYFIRQHETHVNSEADQLNNGLIQITL